MYENNTKTAKKNDRFLTLECMLAEYNKRENYFGFFLIILHERIFFHFQTENAVTVSFFSIYD